MMFIQSMELAPHKQCEMVDVVRNHIDRDNTLSPGNLVSQSFSTRKGDFLS